MKNIILVLTGATLLSLSVLSFASNKVCIRNLSGAVIEACDESGNCKKAMVPFKIEMPAGEISIYYYGLKFKYLPLEGASPIRLVAHDTIKVTGDLFAKDGNRMKVSDPRPNTCF